VKKLKINRERRYLSIDLHAINQIKGINGLFLMCVFILAAFG